MKHIDSRSYSADRVGTEDDIVFSELRASVGFGVRSAQSYFRFISSAILDDLSTRRFRRC